MAAQTAQHTSILQKILAYLELASKVAEVVPEPHVQAISLLVDTLSADLFGSSLISSPHQALQAAAAKAQVTATKGAQAAPSGNAVVSTFR
jgi:hypothetical protein